MRVYRKPLTFALMEIPDSADMAVVWNFIDGFLDREREVMRGLYNQDGSASDVTYAVMGERLGISKARVGQIRDRVFRKLRHTQRRRLWRLD